jgi:hypothetical protein
MRAHRPVKIGSVNTIIAGLRKKLTVHGLGLVPVNGFGWELPRRDRTRALALLATQQTGFRKPIRRPWMRKSAGGGMMAPDDGKRASGSLKGWRGP